MESFIKKPVLSLIIYLGEKKVKRRFDREPIMIGACARSGTTLLLSILSSHPDIFSCPRELGLFHKVVYDTDQRPVPIRIDRL